MVLDEDNALIGTSEDEEDQSPLYISYSSETTCNTLGHIFFCI